ncbi:MAG TPA: sigma-70 family RNA polymerase sigma factor [Gemmataceae bacterium]|nr:sigma-70 family RNA polymerase sigma factor [Gemmataceae bacterium]
MPHAHTLDSLTTAQFDSLFTRLVRQAQRHLHGDKDAEDIVQDALCKALSCHNVRTLERFLWRSVARACITRVRKIACQRRHFAHIAKSEEDHFRLHFEQQTRFQRIEAYHIKANTFPESHRRILTLWEEGYSFEEISAITSIRIEEVRQIWKVMVTLLRQELRE